MFVIKKTVSFVNKFLSIFFIRYGVKLSIRSISKRERKLASEYKYMDLRRLTKEAVKSYKKSDTLYVVGSGGSLNKLTDKQWDVINAEDTFFLNFNIMLRFSPTYYMFEVPSDLDRKIVFYEWTRLQASYYSRNNVCVIFRHFTTANQNELSLIDQNFLSRALIPYESDIFGISKRGFGKYLHSFMSNDYFPTSDFLLPNFKASLFTAVYFGYLAGYKNIRLVGVDLGNTAYFYESYSYEDYMTPTSGQIGSAHKTDTQGFMKSISVSNAIEILFKEYLCPKGIKLTTANSESSLAKIIPVEEIKM